MIQSSISLSLEVQPCIKNELTFRNRRHHWLVRKRGSKLTVKPGTKRQISLHRGTTWVTSVSPNAKLTPSPVNQVLYLCCTAQISAGNRARVAFRYKTWLTGERVTWEGSLRAGTFSVLLARVTWSLHRGQTRKIRNVYFKDKGIILYILSHVSTESWINLVN